MNTNTARNRGVVHVGIFVDLNDIYGLARYILIASIPSSMKIHTLYSSLVSCLE